MAKWIFLGWLVVSGLLHGQAILEPPFGLKWGDSPTPLLDWASRHQLDVRMTVPGKTPDLRMFRIDRKAATLPDSTATAIEARYLRGRMIEVTVHYGQREDSSSRVEAAFNKLKRELGIEHGKLTANQQQRTTENDFTTRTLSYHREPVRGLFLLLAFTEVEDKLRQSKEATFSLIYRNDNLRQRLEIESGNNGGGSR